MGRDALRTCPRAALFLAVMVVSSAVSAATVLDRGTFRLRYRGELRSLGAAVQLPDGYRAAGFDPDADVASFAGGELRLMLWGRATPFVGFEGAVSSALQFHPSAAGEAVSLATRPPLPKRFFELAWDAHESDELSWRTAAERLNLSLRAPVLRGLRLTIGRQAASWGFGRYWHPADLVSPRRPVELYREYAPGVDAMQLRFSVAERLEVRGLFVPDSGDSADHFGALRVEAGLGPLDLAATGGYDHGRGVFGLGLRLGLGVADLEGEAVYFHDPDVDDHVAAVLGATFQLPLGLVATLEFAHDGSGASGASGYLERMADPAFAAARVTTLGRWYAAMGLAARPFSRLDLGADALFNLSDSSAALNFHLAAGVSDEAWIRFNALVGLGDRGEPGVPGSEYGALGSAYVFDVRLYF